VPGFPTSEMPDLMAATETRGNYCRMFIEIQDFREKDIGTYFT
jgi:hypothetical protein